MSKASLLAFVSVAALIAALPAQAQNYQPARSAQWNVPNIPNIPWAQWSGEITPPRPDWRTRTVSAESRYWYIPAPDGEVRRYASYTPQEQVNAYQPSAPQSLDPHYYYPQQQEQYYNRDPAREQPQQRSRGASDPRYQRQLVEYSGNERPGTVIIDTNDKFLFLVQEGGQAIRYGIGVGKPGFEWAGEKSISRKAEWPDWTPPDEMLKRRPDLPRFMPGGPGNPLGARAMYLGSSLYRIHGTSEPWTIGHAVSSGCIRMVNEDVIDLYNRVRIGTHVIVI